MKYLLFLPFILFGCDGLGYRSAEFGKMKPPVLLLAKDPFGNISLCDSQNKVVTFSKDYYFALTIASSYQVGDTILFAKPN